MANAFFAEMKQMFFTCTLAICRRIRDKTKLVLRFYFLANCGTVI